MSLLTLKDIGKIYVSEGSVAVGIRGVNLSFEKGEFVAVTGKSGSGKSTLLNIISGMDSYEEGELYVEGQPTSHYLQKDWEIYREKYISFIFQDYNIIDSFTVLQNVELALMNIDDLKERRRRAVELIKRVGLESHMNHKGSKLSGGQKQRTVIARALAKDSPIILADEPTGNLDSQTSEEIINLLREVSKDKLVIVVTHNFEQVEKYTTRHIRIFDGSVESDHVIDSAAAIPTEPKTESESQTDEKRVKSVEYNVKNGLKLGKAIFNAKPKLTFFICLLLIIGTMGLFFITSVCGDAFDILDKHYMFTSIPGRIVFTKLNGSPITEAELKECAELVGAESYMHFDYMLDRKYSGYFEGMSVYSLFDNISKTSVKYDKKVPLSVGRNPEKPGEVVLYLPLGYKTYMEENGEIVIDELMSGLGTLKIVGIGYFTDNNKSPEMIMTREGFDLLTYICYFKDKLEMSATVNFEYADGQIESMPYTDIAISYDIGPDEFYVSSYVFEKEFRTGANCTVSLSYTVTDYNLAESDKKCSYELNINDSERADGKALKSTVTDGTLYIGTGVVKNLADNVMDNTYTQASLFLKSRSAEGRAIELLKEKGYIAASSYSTYSPEIFDIIEGLISAFLCGFLLVISVIFLSVFINLCTSRSVTSFKPDIAIMRSMGIQTTVIKVGIYVRMLISSIPAIVLTAIAGIVIFNTPKLNANFNYLYPWQYAVIIAGMLVIVFLVTRKQIRKLFNSSVKKAIRGGESQ